VSQAGASICRVCGTRTDSEAQFCTGCGNPLDDLTLVVPSVSRCAHCGQALGSTQRFCHNCGSPTPSAPVASPESTTDATLDALEALLAPFSPLVLLERPGTKHSRRCEVVTGPDGQLSDFDTSRLVSLLEEALIWDGFLLAVIRTVMGAPCPCVWHVLNGELFALGADHGASVLDYLEALRPEHWSGREVNAMIAAPSLQLDEDTD
jgi:hypothetical protein